jgi:hypothetical protein
MNGSGSAVGAGQTEGDQSYAFARAGPDLRLTPADDVSATGELGAQALHMGGWAEPLSAANPFNAYVPASTQTAGVVKERVQWSHTFTAALDATLWGALAQTFDERSNLSPSVAGFGSLTPAIEAAEWAEYGLRIGYRWSDHATIEAFLDGISARTYETRVHVGGALKWTF